MCGRICRGSRGREWNVTAYGCGAGHESRFKSIYPSSELVRNPVCLPSHFVSPPVQWCPLPCLPRLCCNIELYFGTAADNSYRRKFKADLQNVTERVDRKLSQLGRDVNEISSDEIESFVKHAGCLKVIRYRSLEEEYSSPKTKYIRIFPSSHFLVIFYTRQLMVENE